MLYFTPSILSGGENAWGLVNGSLRKDRTDQFGMAAVRAWTIQSHFIIIRINLFGPVILYTKKVQATFSTFYEISPNLQLWLFVHSAAKMKHWPSVFSILATWKPTDGKVQHRPTASLKSITYFQTSSQKNPQTSQTKWSHTAPTEQHMIVLYL